MESQSVSITDGFFGPCGAAAVNAANVRRAQHSRPLPICYRGVFPERREQHKLWRTSAKLNIQSSPSDVSQTQAGKAELRTYRACRAICFLLELVGAGLPTELAVSV